MDCNHWRPPEFPPPPPAIHHPYNPYPPPLLPQHRPSYYPNPNPNPAPCTPQAGHAVGPAADLAANANAGKGLAAYYYARMAADPISNGQIPPRPFVGSNLPTPSHAAPPQMGAQYNNKKGSNPTRVVQSAYCGVCNIECNTQEVLNTHKLGKKHRNKLQKLQNLTTPEPQKPQVTTNPEEKKEQKRSKDAPEKDLEAKKRKVLEGGLQLNKLMVCTLCNVVANSQKVFDSHIFGSKHAGNVKKQQEAAAVS